MPIREAAAPLPRTLPKVLTSLCSDVGLEFCTKFPGVNVLGLPSRDSIANDSILSKSKELLVGGASSAGHTSSPF